MNDGVSNLNRENNDYSHSESEIDYENESSD